MSSTKDVGCVEVFVHTANSTGDLIYHLPIIRSLGGGDLWLMHPTEDWRADKVMSLLRLQPYLKRIGYKNGNLGLGDYKIPVALNLWTAFLRGMSKRKTIHTNNTDLTCDELGLPHVSREEPWLTVDEPRRVAPVVFNVTPRYRNPEFPWREVYERYGRQAIFVGLRDEKDAFEAAIGPIVYYPTPTFLDLARVIAGCELFIGNQSCAESIAESLKKPIILECAPPKDGWSTCRWDRPGKTHVYERSDLPWCKQRVSVPVNHVVPVKERNVLITGGIGDVFSVDGMLTPEERKITTAYLACPQAETIAGLLKTAKTYKGVKTVVLPTGSIVSFSPSDVERLTGNSLPDGIEDWSISHIFLQEGRKFLSSSFLAHPLVSLPKVLPTTYAVVFPASHALPTWPGRNFDDGDWKTITNWLKAIGWIGVVLGQGDDPIPDDTCLVDMRDKATMPECVEILKHSQSYLGIDSSLSVLAAKIFPPSRLSVKSVQQHCYKWKHIYFAPQIDYSFLTEKIKEPQ